MYNQKAEIPNIPDWGEYKNWKIFFLYPTSNKYPFLKLQMGCASFYLSFDYL